MAFVDQEHRIIPKWEMIHVTLLRLLAYRHPDITTDHKPTLYKQYFAQMLHGTQFPRSLGYHSRYPCSVYRH